MRRKSATSRRRWSRSPGPTRKDFKLFFDKESGLPVKLVATVVGFDGNEFTQETTLRELQRL